MAHPAQHTRRILLTCALTLALVSLASAIYFWRLSQTITPLTAYRTQVNFPLYYPKDVSPRPQISTIQVVGKASLNYRLKPSDTTYVMVTQQARPKSLQNFRLDGFDQLATPHGTVYVGTASDSATAILTTESTLITLRGSEGVDRATLTTIAQNMKPL